MKKIHPIAVALLIVLISAVTVSACSYRHHDPAQRAEWMMKRMTEQLDLNAEQQAKLRAVKAEFDAGMQKYREQRRQMFDELAANIEKPQLDKNLLMEVVETRKQAYDDIAPRVVDKIIEFHASLNPEQRKKLAERMEQFREHFKERHSG